MTPDEVVNLLKELTEIREKECGNIPPYRTSKEAIALSSAITIIQDYQKLRERVSVEKIEAVVNSAILFDANIKPIHKLTNSIVTAIVTYLGGEKDE